MEIPLAVQEACPSSDLADSSELKAVPLGMQIAIVCAIIIPFIGLIAGVVMAWGYGFGWIELASFVVMYYLTGLGITLGFHRLFTHRSFETTQTVKVILAILGSMAVQGPLVKWVAVHRRHHQHSDTHADPHSPHVHGDGLMGLLRGLYHSHMGWMFDPDPGDLFRHVQDLTADRVLRAISELFPVWMLIGLLIPTAAGGILSGSWFGALLGFLWGGLARVFMVHHTTWSINSACHVWGRRPFRSSDESRNNVLFGVLAMGEGWHNNHHAFPTSARHGLQWWQVDATYAVVRLLKMVGLAWDVRLPGPQAMAIKAHRRPEV